MDPDPTRIDWIHRIHEAQDPGRSLAELRAKGKALLAATFPKAGQLGECDKIMVKIEKLAKTSTVTSEQRWSLFTQAPSPRSTSDESMRREA